MSLDRPNYIGVVYEHGWMRGVCHIHQGPHRKGRPVPRPGGDPLMPKPAHYRGRYHVASRKVRERANANPFTTCWRCGRTLVQHPPHKNGKPAKWTAGHVIDSDPNSPLAPEASTCNTVAGGKLSHQRQRSRRRGVPTEPATPPRRTSARWQPTP